MGVDTNHVVGSVCKHSCTSIQIEWGTTSVPAWRDNPRRQSCEESRPRADRLLIKPTAVDQAGADAHERTNRGKDTKNRVNRHESHAREHRASLPARQDSTRPESQPAMSGAAALATVASVFEGQSPGHGNPGRCRASRATADARTPILQSARGRREGAGRAPASPRRQPARPATLPRSARSMT